MLKFLSYQAYIKIYQGEDLPQPKTMLMVCTWLTVVHRTLYLLLLVNISVLISLRKTMMKNKQKLDKNSDMMMKTMTNCNQHLSQRIKTR